mmetsp:Transcript_17780/g.45020  ORF Transcript_17780/g.45020 Transcript_17780/m.45020 type:complete len:304 (+) Transcript_17780:1033-1944(+)
MWPSPRSSGSTACWLRGSISSACNPPTARHTLPSPTALPCPGQWGRLQECGTLSCCSSTLAPNLALDSGRGYNPICTATRKHFAGSTACPDSCSTPSCCNLPHLPHTAPLPMARRPASMVPISCMSMGLHLSPTCLGRQQCTRAYKWPNRRSFRSTECSPVCSTWSTCNLAQAQSKRHRPACVCQAPCMSTTAHPNAWGRGQACSFGDTERKNHSVRSTAFPEHCSTASRCNCPSPQCTLDTCQRVPERVCPCRRLSPLLHPCLWPKLPRLRSRAGWTFSAGCRARRHHRNWLQHVPLASSRP